MEGGHSQALGGQEPEWLGDKSRDHLMRRLGEGFLGKGKSRSHGYHEVGSGRRNAESQRRLSEQEEARSTA